MYGNFDINYYTVLHGLNEEEQLEVWSWVLGKHVSLNQLTTSPFRPDQHPFCKLRAYNGIIFFTDFAFPEFSKFTCIHGIEFFRRKGLNDAASFIYTNMYFGKRPVITHNVVQTGITLRGRPSKTEIHFIPFVNENKEACFTQEDANYWQPVGVSADNLKEANVFSCHHFYINGTYMKPQRYPCFAYVSKETGKIKIYVPYADKEWKWFNTQGKNEIFKLGTSDKLLITKSVKDALVIYNLLPDWEIWSFSNEGVIPDVRVEDKKTIKILYDNDKAGYNASEKIAEYFTGQSIFFKEEEAKDAYEFAYKYGTKRLKKELKQLLNEK